MQVTFQTHKAEAPPYLIDALHAILAKADDLYRLDADASVVETPAGWAIRVALDPDSVPERHDFPFSDPFDPDSVAAATSLALQFLFERCPR